jgi:D-serine deaminase-like pyridoxal phosphate-dependent protein
MRISELPTPCLVVDIDRMERNIASWAADVRNAGARLRPHIKTHKSPDIGRMQLAAGATGIAVAKTREAEIFVEAGFDDVVIAYPVVGAEKWERIARLAKRARIGVNVESAVAAEGLSEAARQVGVEIEVYLEVDTGFHRCGIPAEDTRSLARLGRQVVELDGLRLIGVTTHRNIFFEGAHQLTKEEAGSAEGAVMIEVASGLRAHGLPVIEVTGGGTATGRAMAGVSGVTEVRAGTYVLQDLMQLGLGAAQPDELALTVLCTVVSRRAAGAATVDGGSKTFSGDRGLSDSGEDSPTAVGVNCDAVIERLTEEHGMLRLGRDQLAIGDRVSFYPMHACTAVNLADELYGVRHGIVEHVWNVSARGART